MAKLPLTHLDVLIVYSENLARSASTPKSISPFAKSSRNNFYNIVYGYFLATCAKNKLKAAFSTSGDIVGAGTCQSFWTYTNNKWQKHDSPCYSNLIFDKFSPTSPKIKASRDLLFSLPSIKPFNDPELFNLFFDKHHTYTRLSKYSIPTIVLDNQSLKTIDDSCVALSKLKINHPTSKDFGNDIIMKDRFGAGGHHIYKFKSGQIKQMCRVVKKHPKISFIIQPFTLFDKGFTYLDIPASTDIRLVYLQGKIVQSYIRVAKENEFRCNEHQGGLLTYLALTDLPTQLVDKSNQIAMDLNNNSSLFTLDFIISNNGNSYLLEGNTSPGLDWNMTLENNENEAKKLIGLVALELSARSKFSN